MMRRSHRRVLDCAAMRHARLAPRLACEVVGAGPPTAALHERVVERMYCGMEPWELAAREAIRDLVAGYAHAADSGRFDDVAGLFAADGVLETPDRVEHRGREAIRAFLGGAGAALADATAVPLIRHHVSSLRLAVTGPDDATGAAYFLVVTQRGPDHWGRYRDRYVRRDDRWLFAHRRVRLDGWAPGSWAAERRR
jgi:uncharacterized protein (TIGR02246 family)